jgi:hypothetical protein
VCGCRGEWIIRAPTEQVKGWDHERAFTKAVRIRDEFERPEERPFDVGQMCRMGGPLADNRHVCGNPIVWNASHVIEESVRHIGDVAGRFHIQLADAVKKYLTAGAVDETARVNRARSLTLGQLKMMFSTRCSRRLLGAVGMGCRRE